MILVTGGTGLVGAHLLLHLIENGEQVRAMYRTASSCSKTKALFSYYQKEHLFGAIEWIAGDILDIPSLEIAFQDIKQVYHCAALISFDPKDEEAIRKTNIEGTANMVNLSLTNKVEKFCFVSSIAALGDLAPHETEITETTEWNPEKPHSDYAISKYGAEMEVWRGQQEGLKVIIVNPGVILGPGFPSQGSGILFSNVKKGLLFYTLGTTAFIAVPDVINSMYRLMKSDCCNERFTVIAENLAYKNVIFSMADALKVKRPTLKAGPLLTSIAWRLDALASFLQLKQHTFSRVAAKASHSKTPYSSKKIVDELNPSFISIKKYIHEIASTF
ncbi:NAD-dependent epimerase/dehydratase family protein [Flavobacterium sp. RSSA_27]|uniref:NAD-dependent epimerase/dehydratase family protein n=1 Tax=Flavobacterium sp. RSSA_27 TaxID=3447667 RepID=UPI003F3131CB